MSISRLNFIFHFGDICLFPLNIANRSHPDTFKMVALESSTGSLLWEDMYGLISENTRVDYSLVGWNRKLLIQTISESAGHSHNNHNSRNYGGLCKLMIRVIDAALPVRDVYMFMLEHLNEDFDDDLLQ